MKQTLLTPNTCAHGKPADGWICTHVGYNKPTAEVVELVVGSRGLPLALCAECSARQGRVGAVAESPECDQCEVDRQRAYIRSQNPGVTFTAWLIKPDGRQLGVTIQQQ